MSIYCQVVNYNTFCELFLVVFPLDKQNSHVHTTKKISTLLLYHIRRNLLPQVCQHELFWQYCSQTVSCLLYSRSIESALTSHSKWRHCIWFDVRPLSILVSLVKTSPAGLGTWLSYTASHRRMLEKPGKDSPLQCSEALSYITANSYCIELTVKMCNMQKWMDKPKYKTIRLKCLPDYNNNFRFSNS